MTLQLKNLTYSIANEQKQIIPIIKNITMNVNNGEFVSLIGKSGTGKSTILKLVAGILKQDAGEITLMGKRISLGDVGYMPQRDLLLPWRTVIDNIMLSGEIRQDLKLTKEEVRMWLDRVGLLAYENALPKELSGGMRQRAAFLRTLLAGSDVLLLDEPFGALDAMTKREMQSWLLDTWQGLNKTVLFITHDLEEAIYLSDRIILLHRDKSIEHITVDLPRPRKLNHLHTMQLVNLRQALEKKIENGP